MKKSRIALTSAATLIISLALQAGVVGYASTASRPTVTKVLRVHNENCQAGKKVYVFFPLETLEPSKTIHIDVNGKLMLRTSFLLGPKAESQSLSLKLVGDPVGGAYALRSYKFAIEPEGAAAGGLIFKNHTQNVYCRITTESHKVKQCYCWNSKYSNV